MTALLDIAIDAHGGWERWKDLKKLTAQVSVGGGLWPLKGKVGILDHVQVEIDCRRQRTVFTPFLDAGKKGIYEPNRVAIELEDGSVLESRENPRAAFATHVRETQWDNLHLIYFSGYAMWTYLTMPFLLRMPGFKAEEIEPWREGDDEWRRLHVTFPADVPSHGTEQTFYFNKAGILSRHDYSADVLGGTPAANYALDPKTFSGLVVPTKRRVYGRAPDGSPMRDLLAVSIDFHNIVAT
ncbi:hypothetical protein ACSFA8_19700 [Variovorax sp. RT4R15]|uniref:hypothetical protein n=1 Tax=Variovorax sp. RT4R15 TaxID=3443737 RepID=UPI003F451474